MKFILTRTILYSLSALFLTTSCLFAQNNPPPKIKASSVQVEMIQSGEIELPAEFKIALYENLLRQLDKKKGSLRIYRDGDSNAASATDLVVLRATVQKFKAGSERARQVTTFAGATSITVHCTFTDQNGNQLLERDVNGKVRFFGGNLRATHDFAKKAAQMVHDNLTSPTAGQ